MQRRILSLYKFQPSLICIIYYLFWELGVVWSSGDTKERCTQNLIQSQLTSKHSVFVPEWLQIGNSPAHKDLFETFMSLQFVQKTALVFSSLEWETPSAWEWVLLNNAGGKAWPALPLPPHFPDLVPALHKAPHGQKALGKEKPSFFTTWAPHTSTRGRQDHMSSV